MERMRSETLKLLVVSDVGRRSSLSPHDQHEGGNLPGQGQPRQLRPHAFDNQSCVELFEGAWLTRSNDCGTLEQVLQIVIAVRVAMFAVTDGIEIGEVVSSSIQDFRARKIVWRGPPFVRRPPGRCT